MSYLIFSIICFTNAHFILPPGPESNMHLVPYLFHTALYVLNTTRLATKEMNGVDKYMTAAIPSWKEDATSVDGSFYHLIVSLMVHTPER